eukprot:297569-Alexandrium_andersonii.AAC.1
MGLQSPPICSRAAARLSCGRRGSNGSAAVGAAAGAAADTPHQELRSQLNCGKRGSAELQQEP